MGMLGAAFLQGAGQGMNTLAAGLMRGVERDEEQAIWEKRAALLEKMRIESARTMRKEEAAFADERFPTLLSQGTQRIAAEGSARTAADTARMNDPALQAAQAAEAERKRDEAVKNYEAMKNNPRVVAADVAAAKRAAYQAEAEFKRMTPLMASRAGAVAAATTGATESARQKYAAKDKKNPITDLIDAWEGATGTKMTPEMRKMVADAKIGIGKSDDQSKLIDSMLNEFVKTGEIKPEDVGPTRARIVQSFSAAKQDNDIAIRAQQDREGGNIVESIAAYLKAGGTLEAAPKFYTPDELKKYKESAKPATKEQSQAAEGAAPKQRAPAEPNPFVDRTGKPLPNAPRGGGSLLSTTVAPAVSKAADSVGSAMNEAYKRSLQLKIQRGEPLSQGEQIRARQLGLIG